LPVRGEAACAFRHAAISCLYFRRRATPSFLPITPCFPLSRQRQILVSPYHAAIFSPFSPRFQTEFFTSFLLFDTPTRQSLAAEVAAGRAISIADSFAFRPAAFLPPAAFLISPSRLMLAKSAREKAQKSALVLMRAYTVQSAAATPHAAIAEERCFAVHLPPLFAICHAPDFCYAVLHAADHAEKAPPPFCSPYSFFRHIRRARHRLFHILPFRCRCRQAFAQERPLFSRPALPREARGARP